MTYPKNKLLIQILDDSTDDLKDLIVEIVNKYKKI